MLTGTVLINELVDELNELKQRCTRGTNKIKKKR